MPTHASQQSDHYTSNSQTNLVPIKDFILEGPPLIAHIRERPTDGIILSRGNPHQDARARREGENGPARHLVIRLYKRQVLLISRRPQIHSYLVTH